MEEGIEFTFLQRYANDQPMKTCLIELIRKVKIKIIMNICHLIFVKIII